MFLHTLKRKTPTLISVALIGGCNVILGNDEGLGAPTDTDATGGKWLPDASTDALDGDGDDAIGHTDSNTGERRVADGSGGNTGAAGRGGSAGMGGAAGRDDAARDAFDAFAGRDDAAPDVAPKDRSDDVSVDHPMPPMSDASIDAATDVAFCTPANCPNGCCEGATCVSTASQSPNRCGTLGALCTDCGARHSCSSGVCTCATGFANCQDAAAGCATDLSTNTSCGACGNSCQGGTPICAPSGIGTNSFVCASGCPGSSPTRCGMTCVDTASNDSHCNGCNLACTGGKHCVGSACTCMGGQRWCEATNTCAVNDVAACGPTCTRCTAPTGGSPTCDGTTCGQTCGSQTPSYCPASHSCVNTNTDLNNCGACGVTCAGGKDCVAGGCSCPPGTHECGGICVSNTSPSNCGTTACTPCSGPPSGNGSATCDGTSCGITCQGARTPCNGDCVDTQTNPQHCNSCGVQCRYGLCQAGACSASFFGAGNLAPGIGSPVGFAPFTLVGIPVTAGLTSTVAALGLQTTTKNIRVRIGLYSDAGGEPGTLLTQTALLVSIAGSSTEGPVPPVGVEAGTVYWVMALAENLIEFACETVMVTWRYRLTVNGFDSLPLSASTPSSVWANYGDFYMVTAP
jgi:hypothetical protein